MDEEDNYRMNHKNCINVLKSLHRRQKKFKPMILSQGDITAENMVENYRVIEEYFRKEF